MAESEFLSFRKFAERMNTSEANVRKAIKAGKITEASIDRSNPKRPKIHIESGRLEWAKNFTPEKIQSQALADKLEGKNPDEDPEELSEVDESGEIVIRSTTSYTESLRIEKLFKAKTAQLEYNEKRQRLVDKDSVYREFYAIAQSVRTSAQAMPDKLVDHIIAEFSLPPDRRPDVHRLLSNDVIEWLESLSMKLNFN